MYLWLYFDDDVKLTVVNRVKYIPSKWYNSYGIYVVILISNICTTTNMHTYTYIHLYVWVSYYHSKIWARYRYLHKKAHLSCLLGSSKRRLILRAFDSNETNVFTLYIKQTVRFSCSIVTEQGNEWLY